MTPETPTQLTPAQLDEAGMATIKANEAEIQKKVPVLERPVA